MTKKKRRRRQQWSRVLTLIAFIVFCFGVGICLAVYYAPGV